MSAFGQTPRRVAGILETDKIYGKGTGQAAPMQPIRPWIVGVIGVFAEI